ARRFDASGQPLNSGVPVDVSARPTDGSRPGLAMDDSGQYVVAWVVGSMVDYQRFDSTGTPLEQNPNGTPRDASVVGADSSPTDPLVAMNAQGAFAIVWSHNGGGTLSAQQFTPEGHRQGRLLVVNPVVPTDAAPPSAT